MVILAITVETLTCYIQPSRLRELETERITASLSPLPPLHASCPPSQHPLLPRDKTEGYYSWAVSGISLFPTSKSQRKKRSISGVKIFKVIRNSFQIQGIPELKKKNEHIWFSWLSLLIKNILCYRVLKKVSTILFLATDFNQAKVYRKEVTESAGFPKSASSEQPPAGDRAGRLHLSRHLCHVSHTGLCSMPVFITIGSHAFLLSHMSDALNKKPSTWRKFATP